jgi:thiamine-monophosphate kinase
MSDEASRIAALSARLRAGGAGVVLGIGDDAAVLAPFTGGVVLTVDTSIEGVHFRRGWAPLRTLARRAVIAAVSDLAAMGARPRATLVALALPASIDDAAFLELIDGTADAARETGATLVGGNLSAAQELSITTTAIGEAGKRVLTRSGAKLGDAIYVTGVLGAAALGLAHLTSGRDTDTGAAPFVARWCSPTARLADGQALVRDGATACIDVSDGLSRDLGQLCAASGVAARLELASLPMLEGQAERARALGLDAGALALTGGEDYELVFTGRASAEFAAIGRCIGEIVSGTAGEVCVVDADGERVAVAVSGFEHFRAAPCRPTALADLVGCAKYRGRARTLAQMSAAIRRGAKEHR